MDIPRSISERLSFVPWWRSLLAAYYDQQRTLAEGGGQPWSLPAGERDELVIAAFSTRAFGASGQAKVTASIKWCNDAHYRSSSNGAKIRAMIIGGLTNEEIAPHFATAAENIEMYSRLFFDIRECLKFPHWMDSFLRLESVNMIGGTNDTNEVTWLTMSYHLGHEIADHAMSGRLPFLSAQDLAAIYNKICDMVAGQAFMHVVSNTVLHSGGRAVDLERHLQILDINKRAGAGGGGNGSGSPHTSQGMDVVEWMVEAADRGVFDPGIWNEVRGATGITRKVIEMENPQVAALPPSTRMPLGVVERQRLLDSIMPRTKLSCKRPNQSAILRS